MARRTPQAAACLAVLAILLGLAAVLPPTALAVGEAAAAAEGPQVTFSAKVIEASNPPRPAPPDPGLAPLVAELKRLFQFTQYKLLGTPAGSARVGQMWQAPLPGGVTLQATPTAVDPGGIQVQVKLLRGGAMVVNSTVRVASGGQVMVGGTPSPSGTLIVALQAKSP